MRLSHTLRNSKWKMAIDPNAVSNNWYLNPKNQARFGRSGKFLFIISIIYGICEGSIHAIIGLYFKMPFFASAEAFGVYTIKYSLVYVFYINLISLKNMTIMEFIKKLN